MKFKRNSVKKRIIVGIFKFKFLRASSSAHAPPAPRGLDNLFDTPSVPPPRAPAPVPRTPAPAPSAPAPAPSAPASTPPRPAGSSAATENSAFSLPRPAATAGLPAVSLPRQAATTGTPAAPPTRAAAARRVPTTAAADAAPAASSSGASDPRRTRSGRQVRPVDRLNLSAVDSVTDIVPTTFRQAMQDPQWRASMSAEYQALIDNNTWSLVPRPLRANVVTGKWIFLQKFHSDGTLARNKARWVVRGYSQRPGIDYEETFSPVVKPATIRLVLHIAVSGSWPIRQLDVKNAFLHGSLEEVVYCQQPPGFVDASRPDHVCRLHKSLYGLKQAPRAWYHRFASYIATLGFVASATDTSLFVLHSAADTAYLLLYVDDIIVTASSASFLEGLLARLHSEFAMIDLGDLHYFLGMKVSRSPAGLFLSQRQYALDILQLAGMSDGHPSPTPVNTSSKLSASDGELLPDSTDYRSIVGG
ncbi:hypothetical protein QYE76_019153 [Lolium multiflorum]|uniref:Reverse transcriptase Ty1/copia-type domain-containing protein n=1 Tax=Lolium multiflorum TaxID=4521 RepID=A0AAD8R3E3_LOLMU|nr:hypothetical protein QYE76_019153 [Lolium multiflorum]